jgi:hypothetical protein
LLSKHSGHISIADGRLVRTAAGGMIYDCAATWAAAQLAASNCGRDNRGRKRIIPVQAFFYQLGRRTWDSNPRGHVNALMVFKSERNPLSGRVAALAFSD